MTSPLVSFPSSSSTASEIPVTSVMSMTSLLCEAIRDAVPCYEGHAFGASASGAPAGGEGARPVLLPASGSRSVRCGCMRLPGSRLPRGTCREASRLPDLGRPPP